MVDLRMVCAGFLLATAPAAAETATSALTELQEIVATGTIGTDALPAVAVSAEGCVLHFQVEDSSDQLNTLVRARSSGDARSLQGSEATDRIRRARASPTRRKRGPETGPRSQSFSSGLSSAFELGISK